MTDPTARDLLQQLRDGINQHVVFVEEGKQFEELLAAIDSYLATPEPAAEPTDDELLEVYGRAKRDYCYEGPIDDWPKRAERASTIHGLRAVLARWGHQTPRPIPLDDPPGPCPASGS